MPIVLYDIAGSAPCTFVRMLAKLEGIELHLKLVDLLKGEQHSSAYLKVNPFHKVPALDDDGFIIYESVPICYYLISKYAPNSTLLPKDIYRRARVDQILASVSSIIQPHISEFYYAPIHSKKQPTTNEILTFEEGVIQGLEKMIGIEQFATGGDLTLADLSLIAHMNNFIKLPFFDKSKHGKLVSYYERVSSAIPCFQEMCGPLLHRFETLWTQLT